MIRVGSEVRWHMKKTARRACLAGTALIARSGVRVLTYHRFASRHHDPFAVAPDVFARQMEWLAARRMAVSLDAVRDRAAGRTAVSLPGVLVTIDDGFESLYRTALPILQRYNIPAVAFLPAGFMDGNGEADDPEPRLSWKQARELASAGVEIGSHGWSHRSFGHMGVAEMRAEALESRRVLAERCCQVVRSFAYPFGRWDDYDASSARVLSSSGYECAFTSQHGAVSAGADLYELPRVKIEGGEAMWAFAGSCRGGLDAWSVVDRGLWRLQSDHA